MQDFLTFISSILSDLSAFLMTEPAVWFVGIFLLLAVVELFKNIISWR